MSGKSSSRSSAPAAPTGYTTNQVADLNKVVYGSSNLNYNVDFKTPELVSSGKRRATMAEISSGEKAPGSFVDTDPLTAYTTSQIEALSNVARGRMSDIGTRRLMPGRDQTLTKV